MRHLKKNLVWLTTKLIGQKLDPINAKEYYNFYLTRKTKLVERRKAILEQPKTFKSSNNVIIKSVITEHPITLHKLFKTIRQAEKFSWYRQKF